MKIAIVAGSFAAAVILLAIGQIRFARQMDTVHNIPAEHYDARKPKYGLNLFCMSLGVVLFLFAIGMAVILFAGK